MSRAWMPLYIADYLADTGHLTTLEHGAYMLLIMHYWKTGGLPSEDERLSRIARLSLEQWSSIASTIKAFFDDGWHHDRIDAELAKADEKYEKRANAGKKGGQARAMRKQNPSNASAMVNHSHSHSQIKRDFQRRKEEGGATIRVFKTDPRYEFLKARWEKERGELPDKYSVNWPFPISWITPEAASAPDMRRTA